LNIATYRTFLELAKTSNFSNTADRLNIVQSTVSSRIVELEKHLDIKLFNRSNRKVELTSAGKALIPYAEQLVTLELEGKKQIHNSSRYDDCLKISVPGSVYREKIAPVVDRFYRIYPEFSMDIQIHKTLRQIELLTDNTIDIGFVSRIPTTKKLDVLPYITYSWILVAKDDYKVKGTITTSELTSLNLAYNHQNPEYNEWLEDILPSNFHSRININSTAQLIEYVEKGYGCAFLPSYAIKEDLDTGHFKEIKITNARSNKFHIYVAVNKKRKDSAVVKQFLELIPELNP